MQQRALSNGFVLYSWSKFARYMYSRQLLSNNWVERSDSLSGRLLLSNRPDRARTMHKWWHLLNRSRPVSRVPMQQHVVPSWSLLSCWSKLAHNMHGRQLLSYNWVERSDSLPSWQLLCSWRKLTCHMSSRQLLSNNRYGYTHFMHGK